MVACEFQRLMKPVNEAIQQHAFFRGMTPEHVALLSTGAKAIQLEAGSMLCREGEPAGQFFLIKSGKIALEAHEPADGTILVQMLGAGDVVGWSWLFAPFVWHFQARVVEPADLIVLSGAQLLVAAERNHDFGYELMKRVVQVVIRRLQTTRKQLLSGVGQPAAGT